MDDQECIQQSAELNLGTAAADVFCQNMQTALKDCTWGYVDNQGASYQNAREICKDEASRYLPVGNWLVNNFNNTVERFSGSTGGQPDDNPDDDFNRHSIMPLWQIILIAAGGVLAVGGAVWGLVGALRKKNKNKTETSKNTVKDSKIKKDTRANRISIVAKIEKQNEFILFPEIPANSQLIPVKTDNNANHTDDKKKKTEKPKKRTKTTYNNELSNLKKSHKKQSFEKPKTKKERTIVL